MCVCVCVWVPIECIYLQMDRFCLCLRATSSLQPVNLLRLTLLTRIILFDRIKHSTNDFFSHFIRLFSLFHFYWNLTFVRLDRKYHNMDRLSNMILQKIDPILLNKISRRRNCSMIICNKMVFSFLSLFTDDWHLAFSLWISRRTYWTPNLPNTK